MGKGLFPTFSLWSRQFLFFAKKLLDSGTQEFWKLEFEVYIYFSPLYIQVHDDVRVDVVWSIRASIRGGAA